MKLYIYSIIFLGIEILYGSVKINMNIENDNSGGTTNTTITNIEKIKQVSIISKNADIMVKGVVSENIEIYGEYNFSGANLLDAVLVDVGKTIKSLETLKLDDILIETRRLEKLKEDKMEKLKKFEKKVKKLKSENEDIESKRKKFDKKTFSPMEVKSNGSMLIIQLGKGFTDEVEIKLPKSLSLAISSKSGTININGMENEFIIDGSNIETNIRRHRGVGTVLTKRGDVEVENYQGVLSLKSKIGDIIVNNASGSLNIKKFTGNVDINLFDGEIKSDMKHGDFTVHNSKFSLLSSKVGSGEVVIDKVKDSDNIDLTLNSGEIFIRNGVSKRISAYCGGGDITFQNVSANLDLDINAGDIYIEKSYLPLSRDNYIKSKYGYVTLNFKNKDQLKISESKYNDEFNYSKYYSKDDLKIRNTETDNFMYIDINHGKISIK
ncbi:MAG: hypothetical protein CR982_02015 [Candidatus Cloacimonadota bacterium]|nr:MAG: hypothetical protein CR982_02015 [Candidatus Cloacimonadota bacterium]PIE78940.1 MAG: hypothetical protein CSA15_05175 [Candidatus Delongbacteria bacterium]